MDDAITRLQRRLDNGETKLTYDADQGGYLASLLNSGDQYRFAGAGVFENQFSGWFSPKAPRALYFNDKWKPDMCMEGLCSNYRVRPQQDINFYTLDVAKTDNPQFCTATKMSDLHLIPGTLNVRG